MFTNVIFLTKTHFTFSHMLYGCMIGGNKDAHGKKFAGSTLT